MELPQRETGMGDTSVNQVTRKALSMKIDHRQDLSLDIVDIGWKFVEPDVVSMHPKTSKNECTNDLEIYKKVLAISVAQA